MAAVCALAGGLLAAGGEASAIAARSAPDSGRPVVILVHGRGQLLGDSAAVRAEWSRVLRSGASAVAGSALLRDDDVWLAWYADALDPLAPVVCDVRMEPATNGDSAQRDDAQLNAFFATAGAALTAALDLFDGYAREEARALAGDLLFLGDRARRCAAERQLHNALARAANERRPVILVAHSFGSLLAYRYLRSASPSEHGTAGIERFVTIGSLLGAPGARQLLLGDRSARVSLPPGVGAWTNIVEPADPLAYPMYLEGDSAGAQIENLTTAPGSPAGDPHDAVRYLRDPTTLRVVVRSWCDAFASGARERAPAPCEAIPGRTGS